MADLRFSPGAPVSLLRGSAMLMVGSGNVHKLAEIRRILEGLSVEVIGADVLPPGPEIEETGETFSANVRIKADEYARRAATLPNPPRWVVADDSGLCVDALGGAPGVYSARYAGEDCSYEDNNRKLLGALSGLETSDRSASFVCAIACVTVPRAGAEPEFLFEVEGRCAGRIASDLCGAEGFGYDPIFVPEASDRSFAEMSADEKNAISHRGRALGLFRERFSSLVAEGSD